MKIVPPTWCFDKYCPECGQGGLLLLCCESCNCITVICDDCCGFYGNPFDMKNLGNLDKCNCHNCKSDVLTIATSDQINNAGIDKTQYY